MSRAPRPQPSSSTHGAHHAMDVAEVHHPPRPLKILQGCAHRAERSSGLEVLAHGPTVRCAVARRERGTIPQGP